MTPRFNHSPERVNKGSFCRTRRARGRQGAHNVLQPQRLVQVAKWVVREEFWLGHIPRPSLHRHAQAAHQRCRLRHQPPPCVVRGQADRAPRWAAPSPLAQDLRTRSSGSVTQNDLAMHACTARQKLHTQNIHKIMSALLLDCAMQARTNRTHLLNSARYLCQHQDSGMRLPADVGQNAGQRNYDFV